MGLCTRTGNAHSSERLDSGVLDRIKRVGSAVRLTSAKLAYGLQQLLKAPHMRHTSVSDEFIAARSSAECDTVQPRLFMVAKESNLEVKASPDRGIARAYDPLPSIWSGEDSDLLERMLHFYPRKPPERILDATVNGGRFWRGSKQPVIGLDIGAIHRPSIIGDNSEMPFLDAAFDVVVYDPPHIPNQGKDKSKDFNARFGLGGTSSKENGYTFSHLYPAFMREAYRVLIAEGVLFCKIADYVHHHRYQWAHVEVIQAATAEGFRACDCIIKTRTAPIIDPRWKKAHHSRRQHSYWLIFRKSNKCE